jgi:tetratricopeptide (TPR) repeat protein
MAGLRQQQDKPDETLQYIEPALAFYQQGGYRSETISCLAILARAKLQKGYYAAADKVHEELLRLAQESNDQSQLARAHAERGSALVREEKFTEALDHLNQAYSIYNAQGIQRSIGYNLASRGEVLSRLGKFDEAKMLLDQATVIATKPGGELKRLAIEAQLALAEMALMEDNSAVAKATAEKVLAAAGTEFKSVATAAKIVIGLSESYAGAKAAGKQTASDAVDLARELNDPAQVANAQLALAATMLLAGDFAGASTNALQAQEVFARLGQVASEWQSLLIAAQASHNLGDKTRASEYAVRAQDTLSKLEQSWGTENYKSYLSRPDIYRLRKQLEQLQGLS